MRATLCFGGSIIAPRFPKVELIRETARVLRGLRSDGHEILAVVGGGGISRRLINAARELGASDRICDSIGIEVTRLNAQLLASALGDVAEPSPLESFEVAVRAMFKRKIPVMGGVAPGQTTDAVAAGLADSSKSDLLIYFVDVGGVYTSDPKRSSKAKKREQMRASSLVNLVSRTKMKPGVAAVVDPLAAKIIQRSNLRTLVLGRREIRRLPKVLKGEGHSGTTILPR